MNIKKYIIKLIVITYFITSPLKNHIEYYVTTRVITNVRILKYTWY